MIRHGYTQCSTCHADPSGAGPLNGFGRAQGDLVLRSRYGRAVDDVGPQAGVLWGALRTPEEVAVGGDLRGAWMTTKPGGVAASDRFILMRADLYADLLLFDHLRIAGSLGYVPSGARAAALTRASGDNLVSRFHWIGWQFDDAWLARAGRIARPFGIRNVEHTLWTRALTRSDIDDDQQHGAALSYGAGRIRAEVMAILGNLQVRPDDYRERGYSAYFEYAPTTRLAIGASGQFTRARRDLFFRVTNYRHVNGVFVRYAPSRAVVLMAELDSVYQSLTWNGHRGGYAAMIQADWEPVQGVHLMATGETKNDGAVGETPSYGAWVSSIWFFAPHADVRVDNLYRRLGTGAETVSLLLQLHVYL
jgi:hypothetical protein